MPKFHSLKVREVRRETAGCVSIAFETPEELKEEYAFAPGQHLTLKMTINGEEVRRTYSICAGPIDGELRVAVKKVPEGLFSTFANEQLHSGDALDVMTPMGRFTIAIDPANEKRYVAFAAGSGITPVISIMKAILQQEPGSEFTLFYGNRSSDSIIFLEEIEGLKNEHMGKLSVYHVLSREHTGADLFNGRITAEKCKAFFDKLIDVEDVDDFFICGPFDMMQEIRQTLQERGVDRKRIHFELFHAGEAPPKVARPKDEEISTIQSLVKITLDGNSFELPLSYDGDTILEAAARAGANLPFACKGGVCATCRAKLVEGRVEMDANYALEPEEIEAGYILTCQSHPKTHKVVVDFDS
jgi:ring-1,2-phenylacetyl-CoA epoxidase subunit PaaE